jgi:hypothetical protein
VLAVNRLYRPREANRISNRVALVLPVTPPKKLGIFADYPISSMRTLELVDILGERKGFGFSMGQKCIQVDV